MASTTQHLIGILGKRSLFGFGLVTFLVAALLATVNLTSRHAMKQFVEEQLGRIPWDVAIYNTEGLGDHEELPKQLGQTDGIERVESMAFLRAKLPEGDVVPEVDGEPLGTPWLSLLAASDPSLLPPQLRSERLTTESGQLRCVLALVGPERAMGKAFIALQGSKQFSLKVPLLGSNEQEGAENAFVAFSAAIDGVVRVERDYINRWLMDQTGSISFVPHVGVILLMPLDSQALERFEAVSTGLMNPEIIGAEGMDLSHVQLAEYMPETVALARLDRERLITAWDIPRSLETVSRIRADLQEVAGDFGLRTYVDSTTLVLLERMSAIARIVGFLAILIALPLLWMAWVLAGNLSGLLMLNERRTLGLMRLRGVPGQLLGKSFLLSIGLGGLVGGLLGLILGSVVPLLIYERGQLPSEVLGQTLWNPMLLIYLFITLGLALLVSRRLVRYATTISPLEASVRVSASEAGSAGIQFGWPQALLLALGIYTLCAWIFDVRLSDHLPLAFFRFLDRGLDFIGITFFLYGAATLLASHRTWIQGLLTPIIKPIGGRLGVLAARHISVKPHRTVAFLLIVSLMASVSLYPTVTASSFQEKAERGAKVQMGTELQITFNTPDLSGSDEDLSGALEKQTETLAPELNRIMDVIEQVEGVESATYIYEALLPNFYLPGYGLRGVPLYLLGDVETYLSNVYSEPELGLGQSFKDLIGQLKEGKVAASPPVAEFWQIERESPVIIGMDEQRRSISLPASGVLAFLAGTPPLTVTDRQGYVQARLDYLNHLFNNNAYLVAAQKNPEISRLNILMPRVVVLAKLEPGAAVEAVQSQIVGRLPVAPLEVNNLVQESQKVGSDMFISLAIENMRIYLIGGLLLALIAILAVAMANYVEDRRTLALLRIRGTAPKQIWRFFAATLISPAFLGLALGTSVALVTGYGLANYIWELREIRTVVQLLPTHLVVSALTVGVALLIIVLILGITWMSSWWVFRRSALRDIQEA